MSLKLSTGLRNALLGDKPSYTSTALSAAASDNSINDAGANFLTEGFKPGQVLEISGFTGTAANNGLCEIVSVTTTKIIISGITLVDDVAGESVTLTAFAQSFKDIFANHTIHVYSGSAPASADAAETGTLLLKITKDSGALTPGLSTNGLNFDAIAAGVLSKNSDTHSGVGLADGTAGYYRVYDNQEKTGESTSAIRMQGTVGTSGTDFIMSSVSIATGATTTLDTHNITLPAS